MVKTSLVVGGLFTVIGIIGIVLNLFPPNDGALAIAGAIIFGAGVVSKAIVGRE
ncbi:MAG TPA: hypothetical protein PK395_05060 [bacterium]|nr:hypothetical protein [bacterium]HQQ00886.1 hypothetical protein [bacterium]